LDPDLAIAYGGRGSAYSELKQYSRAIEDYDRAIQSGAGYVGIYSERASAHETLGQNDEADRDWDRYYRMAGKPAVKHIQTYLREHGYYSGVIDGIYGSGTRAANSLCTADPDC